MASSIAWSKSGKPSMGEDKTARSAVGDKMSAGELEITSAIAAAMANANARAG